MVDEFVKKEDFDILVSKFNDLVRNLNSCKLKREIEFEEFYSSEDEDLNFNSDMDASFPSDEKNNSPDELKNFKL